MMMTVPSEPPVESEVEVSAKPKRRVFPLEYKCRILAEAEKATGRGELGALLRREGLYSSHLVEWRRLAKEGGLRGLTPKKRGPKPKPREDERVVQLERQLAKATARAERAEALVELQKKISRLLGIALPTPPEES